MHVTNHLKYNMEMYFVLLNGSAQYILEQLRTLAILLALLESRAGLGQKIGPGIFWSRRPSTTFIYIYTVYIYILVLSIDKKN